MNQTDFHVLLALADTDRHGYGIMQEVEERSNGRVRLGPATMYGAIKRLVDSGWVEETAKRPATGDDPRRRCYYRLTRAGRKMAAEEAKHLAEVVRVAEAKRLFKVGRAVTG